MSKLPKPGSGIPSPGARRTLGAPKSHANMTPEPQSPQSPQPTAKAFTTANNPELNALFANIIAGNPDLADTINGAFGPTTASTSPPSPLVTRRPSPSYAAEPSSPTTSREKRTSAPIPQSSKSSRTGRTISSRASNTSSYDEPQSHSSRNSVSSASSIGASTPRTSIASVGSAMSSPKPLPSKSSSPRATAGKSTPPTPAPKKTAPPPLPVVLPSAVDEGFRPGDRVVVESMNIVGTLRFIGTTKFKPGTWAGIELDTPGGGKNDGAVAG
ncbi:hypothetical protein BC938DRAFT_478795 [Jimgerdemannia flammicorona]|uniref:CAP-Gly domain-containing protein n=1 Tax=Jimgerdemannia flammicorona TaxID=994334 RepID=A0A433QM92_9FUNG|nr:hypothetical protein BC938DRAFT_478795 [Jimgerdemannia flammicorona]